ncbi:MAG: hypothetical protein KatS3mg129_1146 [Leptospiraceae bacterium]|nr:MAG: hypothetical protein KatS3mg129_1146 [Leptospiraceae bacterium]
MNKQLPIAIDLGAKFTGVLVPESLEKSTKYSGYLLEFDKDNFNYSLRNRLLKRHLKRIKKRKKLVKRLFLLISYYEFQIDWENTEYYNLILGLFNRRGNNILDLNEEESKSILEILSFDDIKEIFSINLAELEDIDTIFDFLNFISKVVLEDKEKEFEEIFSKFRNIQVQDIKNKLKEIYEDKNEIKEKEKALKEFANIINKLLDEKNNKKHRKKYLQDIKSDLKDNKKLINFLKKHNLTIDKFVNLVGNLNNLPLKALRKYFNDKRFWNFYKIYRENPSLWEKDRLKKIYLRWIRSWRPKKKINEEEIKNQKNHINILKTGIDIIEFLLNTNPETTIPPYEIQNNRRPEKCQSLRLNKNYLDKHFKNWKNILIKLLKSDIYNNTEIKYKLIKEIKDQNIIPDPLIKDIYDYILKANSKLKISIETIILQLILDQTKEDDPLKIRDQINFLIQKGIGSKKQGQIIRQTNQMMQKILTEKEINEFLNLAKEYYIVSNLAQKGLWIEDKPEHQILQKCNCKPKLKKNAKESIIKQILGFDVDINEFIKSFEEDKLPNKNKKIKIACKNLSELRDKYKNQFKNYFEKLKRTREDLLNNDEKEHKKIISYVEDLKQYFKEKYNLNEIQIKRFNSPYIYIQLYDVLEKDTSGFYKTCYACTIENDFRSELKSNGNAYAKRLTADSIRPFDSQVKLILERKAHNIEKEILQPLINSLKDSKINLHILIEENNFSFEEQVYELKNNSKKRKEYIVKKQIFEKEVLNKEQRIKEDSYYICAYTGKTIKESEAEFDHIIPQSYSKKLKQTSYNHEANLIYVSREGNQNKKNQIYTLENLNKKYLKQIFETDDINKIKTIIEEKISNLKEYDVYFANLDRKTRNIIRHGLFVPELRDIILNQFLTTKEKAIVNGTQKYFIKYLNQLLYKKYKGQIEIDYSLKSSRDISFFRKEASIKYPEIFKEEIQSYFSHIIDCSVMMVFYYNDKFDVEIEPENIIEFIPDSLKFIRITSTPVYRKSKIHSKQLFKDTLYKEDFVPLYYKEKHLYIGFSDENKIDVKLLQAYKKNKQLFNNDLKTFYNYFIKFIKREEYKNWDNLKDGLIIKFNKQKVQSFLNSILIKILRKQRLTEREEFLYSFFKSISYYLLKENVFNHILKNNKLNEKIFDYLNEINLLKEEFSIKIDNNQIIYHPVYLEWYKLFYLIKEELKEYKKSKNKDINQLNKNIEKKLNEFFKQTIKNPLRHKKQKTIYSLVRVVNNKPGAFFRIKRYNSFNNQPVYQIICSNKVITKGYIKRDNEIDFNTLSIINSLTSYKSVPISDDLVLSDNFVYHDEWFNIDINKYSDLKETGILKLQISPATKQRPYVRVRLGVNDFINLLELDREDLNSLKQNLLLNIKPDHLKKFNNDHPVIKKLGKINGNIKLIAVNHNWVEYQCTIDSFKNELKQMINDSLNNKNI